MNRYLIYLFNLISLMTFSLNAMQDFDNQSKDAAYQMGYTLANLQFKLFYFYVKSVNKEACDRFEKQTFLAEKYSVMLLTDSLPAIEENINNLGEDRAKKEDAFLLGFTSYYRMMSIFFMKQENNDICYVPKDFLHLLTIRKAENPNPANDRFLGNYHQKLNELEKSMKKKLSAIDDECLDAHGCVDTNKRLALIKDRFTYIE